MGDYGKIIITETIFAENFHTCTYPEKTIKDAIEWNSVVGDLLRKRKLISFKKPMEYLFMTVVILLLISVFIFIKVKRRLKKISRIYFSSYLRLWLYLLYFYIYFK